MPLADPIKYKEYQDQYRETNRERLREYFRSDEAKKSNRERAKRYRDANPEKARAQTRQYQKEAREQVLTAYGNRCACCGEEHKEFLAVDHIEGGGKQHFKKLNIHGGASFYFWLRKNSFPPEFRLLCHSCNQAKGLYGFCPHELETGDNLIGEC